MTDGRPYIALSVPSEPVLVGRSNVAVFDERRNTSRVWPVNAEDIERYESAIARLRRDDPKLIAWLEAGAPAIHSEAEHIRWFGEPYGGYATSQAPQQERLA